MVNTIRPVGFKSMAENGHFRSRGESGVAGRIFEAFNRKDAASTEVKEFD
jgi:hypothetical protein